MERDEGKWDNVKVGSRLHSSFLQQKTKTKTGNEQKRTSKTDRIVYDFVSSEHVGGVLSIIIYHCKCQFRSHHR